GADPARVAPRAGDARLVTLFAARAGTRDPVQPFRDLRGIVDRALGAARAMGRDDITQARAAAHAVMAVRPDLSSGDALKAVFRLRASGAV
ncbi:MAG: hypothetical protein SFV21_08120, partial [Rhodospirillaceae bacterium]|nr:hypothetical protein [Rhodospirillaceae bacterium]